MPKIIAPINNIEEIEILHNSGALEFYGGYTPIYWKERFSSWCSINGRTFNEADIDTINNLKNILNYCKNHNIDFSLTLNAPLYLPLQYPLIFKLIEEYMDIGGQHVIIADLGLLLSIRGKKYPLFLHLGTGGTVLNHYAVKFYSNFEISRIILDRQLKLDEIEKIINSSTNVEFDIFMLIGKCPNIEGLCTFLHDSPDRIWHCVENYKMEEIINRRQKTEDGRQRTEDANIWAGVKRTDACGLCQIKRLIELKVHGFKIVGRGASLERKIKAVKGLKKMIDISSKIENEENFIIKAHDTYQEIFGHQCSPLVCYFP